MKYLIKLNNLFIFLISSILSGIVKLYPKKIVPRTLLIIRLDAIGDYVLFRNFLEVLKANERYKEYSITLCGNIAYKEIAEYLDAKFVDRFIWINRKKFCVNPVYKYGLLKQIRAMGFETVINPTYSREILLGDLITKVTGARNKIGSTGAEDKHLKWKLRLFGRTIYNEMIPASKEVKFDFLRNKEFFEKLLRCKIGISSPSILNSEIELTMPSREYVVVFIGASETNKKWKLEYFAEICDYLMKNYNLHIIISGGPAERDEAETILKNVTANNIENYVGNTSLISLIGLIKNSLLLISNDTVAVHLAAAVKTRLICINRGKYLGRFSPYPSTVFNGATFIYPKQVRDNFEEYIKNDKLRVDSRLSINQITADEVKRAIDMVLQNK